MTEHKDNHKLLLSLQSLYRRLAQVMYDMRKSTYKNAGAAGNTSNIKSIINTQIDELVSGYEKREISKTNDQISKRSTDSIKDHQHIDSDYHKTGEAIENELSKYLQTENLTSVTQPGIVTKLTESVWEHIHAALRIARQGDADKAKLHLDIADQALNEVGHYMSSDDFSRLVSSVEQYLFKSQE